jgi:hypothetical protein
MTYPLDPTRAQWRLTLHNRAFNVNLDPRVNLFVAEIVGARSLRLEQTLNGSASLAFSVEGHSNAAKLIQELMTDVMAWRWDEQSGTDIPMGRFIVAQSQDSISEQADTVSFTCHDYLSMLQRRLLTKPQNFAQIDQDDIASSLVRWGAENLTTSAGASLWPGCYLPLAVLLVDPSGATRVKSGTKRDRNYAAQQDVSEALLNLAAVEGGFDLDVIPGLQRPELWPDDQLRIFFPYQGTLRTSDIILEYGSSIAALSRTVNSADYGNYTRVVGSSGSSDANAPPMFAEALDPTANDVTEHPQGLWMTGDNASDVSIQATLNDQAKGLLRQASVVAPSYSLTLRPGFYSWANPRMGDTVRLIIKAGRLSVDTEVRVVGISFDVSDDGSESVGLTVGRGDVTFASLITAAKRDVNALARR